MKKIFSFIIILFSIPAVGQVDKDLFEYEELSFDSIIAGYNYPQNPELGQVRVAYYLKNGHRNKSMTFRNDTLKGIMEYKYLRNKLIRTKSFSEIYSYDSLPDSMIGKIDYEHYNGKEYRYNNNLLTKVKYFTHTNGSTSYNFNIIFEYDSLQRLKKEIHEDKYIGYAAAFEPQTSNIDSLYYKNSISSNYKTFDYYNDSILINYFSDGEMTGYEWLYGNIDRPYETMTFLVNNEMISHLIYKINEDSLVTERFYKVHSYKSPWGGEVDFAGYKKTIVEYNMDGYPGKLLYYLDDELIMTKSILYYTP